MVEIARGGACTLYPREVLHRRFSWDPRYGDEQDALFDELAELGFRHWLLQRPELAEHRMIRPGRERPPLATRGLAIGPSGVGA